MTPLAADVFQYVNSTGAGLAEPVGSFPTPCFSPPNADLSKLKLTVRKVCFD